MTIDNDGEAKAEAENAVQRDERGRWLKGGSPQPPAPRRRDEADQLVVMRGILPLEEWCRRVVAMMDDGPDKLKLRALELWARYALVEPVRAVEVDETRRYVIGWADLQVARRLGESVEGEYQEIAQLADVPDDVRPSAAAAEPDDTDEGKHDQDQ